ncbi:putative transmembrane protein [Halotydeus destructor]|nr:putative transmembrane protein [Halotydeus destructor]
MGSSTLKEALKMYSALYGAQFLVWAYNRKRRGQPPLTAQQLAGALGRHVVQSTLRSSLFLAFNAFAFLMVFCGARHLLGAFYFELAAYLPAMVASYLAIQLERPERRPALAFYVAQIAAETVYNKLLLKGWPVRVPVFGETILFTLALVGLFKCSSSKNGETDKPSFLERHLLGCSGGGGGGGSKVAQSVRNGLLAVGAQAALQLLVLPLVRRGGKRRTNGWDWWDSGRLGVFVGALSLLGRHWDRSTASWPLVGGAAGLLWQPRESQVSQWLGWRAVQWALGPLLSPLAVDLVYSAATAHLFQVAVLEPGLMRPSYLRFLDRVTGGRLAAQGLNGDVLDFLTFGNEAVGASGSLPNRGSYPRLDMRWTTSKFTESFLVWTI